MKETKSNGFLHCSSSQRLQDANCQDEATPTTKMKQHHRIYQSRMFYKPDIQEMVDTLKGSSWYWTAGSSWDTRVVMLPSTEWRLETQVECKMVWEQDNEPSEGCWVSGGHLTLGLSGPAMGRGELVSNTSLNASTPTPLDLASLLHRAKAQKIRTLLSELKYYISLSQEF